AESVQMVHRLYELQGEGRDADAWFWGLWVDPADFPVNIRPWISGRLDLLLKGISGIGEDQAEIERAVDGAPQHNSKARKLRMRGVRPTALRELVLWAYQVAADIEQQDRLDNPGSPLLDTLRQIGGLPAAAFGAPDRELGVELMSVGWLNEVIKS